MLDQGTLIVSLDFELYWGVRDKRSVAAYAENLEAVHTVIPRLLDLFKAYEIHASWASVGLLFAENSLDACRYLPDQKPSYTDKKLSPYSELDIENITVQEEKYYFAKQLLDLIKACPHQEIASHTFSHYYCLESGQTVDEFAADIAAAKSIASENDMLLQSLVFPRNQYSDKYLTAAYNAGIRTFRGNEPSRLHQPRNEEQLSLPIRGMRLLDSYINISGKHSYNLPKANNQLVDLASSCFLRAYSHRLRHFEWLKRKRITSVMKQAAKKNQFYHLWWHPHNFGKNTDINFANLERLFEYYQKLKNNYNMQSLTMAEVYERYY
jgi:peptidoglycan/xylan/chitin deacetylase (PgdA/CDA1 family)